MLTFPSNNSITRNFYLLQFGVRFVILFTPSNFWKTAEEKQCLTCLQGGSPNFMSKVRQNFKNICMFREAYNALKLPHSFNK